MWSLRISLVRPTIPPRAGTGAFASVVGGPHDLLAWLESQLGLHMPQDPGRRLTALYSAMERAIAMTSPQLPIAASYARHPYAVATRVLVHRDSFLMAVSLPQTGALAAALDVDSGNVRALASSLPMIMRQHAVAMAHATTDERETIMTGEPDRLAAVHQAVQNGQQLPRCMIVIEDDKSEWPARWSGLLDLISACMSHCAIAWRPAAPCSLASPGKALQVVQAALLPDYKAAAMPCAIVDDTLTAIRCASAAVAAQAAAGALEALSSEELASAVLICADDSTAAMIDGFLHAAGLPTMGISVPAQPSDVLAVLPLAIEAIGSPADPHLVKELLSLADSPVPKPARRRLLKALDDLPAVGSPAWNRVLRTIRTTWRNGVKAATLIEEWMPAPTRWCRSRHGFDANALDRAVDRVAAWANRRGRRLKKEIRAAVEAGIGNPADAAELDLAVERQSHFHMLTAKCRTLRSLLKQRKLSGQVDRPTIMQLLDVVNSGQASLALHPESAGGPRRVRGLAEVGDFLGTVSRAIWVGPVRSAGSHPYWSHRDVAQMRSSPHAIDLDTTSQRLDALTRAEEVAFCHLSGSLLIIACPSADPAARPHPLWLLITEILRSGLPAPQPFVYEPPLVDSSTTAVPMPPWAIGRATLPVEREPSWLETIQLPPTSALPRRQTVSHSDVRTRLACQVAWALDYSGKLRVPTSAAMPNEAISRGTVAEQILREVFQGTPPGSIAAAEARLDQVLRRRLPRLHAELCHPVARAKRLDFEHSVRDAIPVLQALVDAGISLVFAAPLERFVDSRGQAISWQGQSLRGAIDVIATATVGGARVPIVIDIKYGGADLHKSLLAEGRCTQLVLYSDFVGRRGPVTPVDALGYLVISDGVLYVPAWASGQLASPMLADFVKQVGKVPHSLPGLISDLDTRAAGASAALHAAGVRLQAHPRAAANGGTLHPDLAFVHGPDATDAAEEACKYCKYSLLCGKDRVR